MHLALVKAQCCASIVIYFISINSQDMSRVEWGNIVQPGVKWVEESRRNIGDFDNQGRFLRTEI